MAFGFGIIGCGMISRFHALAIEEVRGARLIGCWNRSAAPAEQLAAEFNATAFASLDKMLADDRIDIVTICTPSGAHLEPAVAAARAGKHVIVEKPLEITWARCQRMIRECETNRVALATIFPSRYNAASQRLKQMIDRGRFGRLTLGDAHVKWYRSQDYYDSGQWRGTWALDGGGALMNQAIHSVDLLTWLMGPVDRVSAVTATLAHERIEVEDVATACLRFANGALGSVVATTAAWPGFAKKIEIHGDRGSAVVEDDAITEWQFQKMTAADRKIAAGCQPGFAGNAGGAADPSSIGHAAHAAQFRDILKSIRAGETPAVDGREGLRSVEIILAIYKSAESGKTVDLPLKRDPILRRKRPH